MTTKLEEIAAELDALSQQDAAALGQLLTQRWGVTPPLAVRVQEVVDKVVQGEPELVGVYLVFHGERKLEVIKTIREQTGGTLQECKALADQATLKQMNPPLIEGGLVREVAQALADNLTRAGAVVEVR